MHASPHLSPYLAIQITTLYICSQLTPQCYRSSLCKKRMYRSVQMRHVINGGTASSLQTGEFSVSYLRTTSTVWLTASWTILISAWKTLYHPKMCRFPKQQTNNLLSLNIFIPWNRHQSIIQCAYMCATFWQPWLREGQSHSLTEWQTGGGPRTVFPGWRHARLGPQGDRAQLWGSDECVLAQSCSYCSYVCVHACALNFPLPPTKFD